MSPARVSLVLGAASLALIFGALGFQYLGGLAPCEMCEWQRWPHIAAAVTGLIGGAWLARTNPGSGPALAIAGATILLIAVAGLLGVYHAGVEWHWWSGPSACTGTRVEFTGLEGLNDDHATVRCDQPAWRLFGISLAGYNAVVSLALATWGTTRLAFRPQRLFSK